jgi:hypothetical protein
MQQGDLMNICPVCGYDRLEFPYTEDGTICPSCGTEFGYDDFVTDRSHLRARWILTGARWWDPESAKPLNWDPVRQLLNIGYPVTVAELKAIEHNEPVSRGLLTLPGHRLDPFWPVRSERQSGVTVHESAAPQVGSSWLYNTGTRSAQSPLRFDGDRRGRGNEYAGSI